MHVVARCTHKIMNFYTLAAKLDKEIRKNATMLDDSLGTYDERYTLAKDIAKKDFIRKARLGIELMEDFRKLAKDIAQSKEHIALDDDDVRRRSPSLCQRTWFITVRPDPNINFPDFYEACRKMTTRSCWDWYEIAFEQKATDDDTLGYGFHLHMIAKGKVQKSQIARNLMSTFQKVIGNSQAIKIEDLKTDDDVQACRNYIVNYESKDGHKVPTKEYDEKWRRQIGLEHIYTNTLPPLPSLVGRQCDLQIEFL